MSTPSNMTLVNQSATVFKTFFLVTTNSGQDIGVAAGNNLGARQTSNPATFVIEGGKTDFFTVFFVDQAGTFWQSQGNSANLASNNSWNVTVTVSGSAANMQMALEATSGSQALSYGPWPIFKVGSVPPGQTA